MTDITFGDKMGSKIMTLKPFSEQENYIVVGGICLYHVIIFFFLKEFKSYKSYIWHTKYFRNI